MKIFGRVIRFAEAVPYEVVFISLCSLAVGLLRGYLCQLLSFSLPRYLILGRGATFSNPRFIRFQSLCRLGAFSCVRSFSKGGVQLGRNFSLGAYSSISNGFNAFSDPGQLIIGDDVGIGEYCFICAVASVHIGSDTIVGQYLSVHPQNHNFSERDELIRYQGTREEGVFIGSNCWIGSKVTFLDGSEVGSGCIVAAGAVVTKKFPSNVVIAGSPARVIKER